MAQSRISYEETMTLFTSQDFEVFDISGFKSRMKAIRTRISPKLSAIGEALAPVLASVVDQPLHVHVAKHARRTVHPPEDTWTALGLDKRGYKKDVHFKIAVSGNCVRLLFEVGPEYYDKAEWALKWNRDIHDVAEALGSAKTLAWFKDEHDEEPAASLNGWSLEQFRDLGHELTRRRDGQLVIGRRIDKSRFLKTTPAGLKRMALATFRPVAPLFSLHEPRILGGPSGRGKGSSHAA
jgi:uncharacterized protein YktB (UPF0637 family)